MKHYVRNQIKSSKNIYYIIQNSKKNCFLLTEISFAIYTDYIINISQIDIKKKRNICQNLIQKMNET